MAFKSNFHIPSAVEMEQADNAEPKVKSAFEIHRATKESVDTSTSTISSTSTKPVPLAVSHTSTQNSMKNRSNGLNGTSVASSMPHSLSAVPKQTSVSLQQSGSQPAQTTTSNNKLVPTPSQNNSSDQAILKLSPSRPGKTNSSDQAILKLNPSRPGKTNSILVSPRQRGNPILKFVRNVPWEFGDIVPDYQLGQTSCALFLSLRYHQLNPNYIHERLKQLGHSYDLRVLLTLIDIKDPHACLKELAKMCILADCTLIVAFSPEEAGRYLETYKSFESKPPDLIMERSEGNLMSRLTDTLTKAKRVNKTDVMTLMSAFGSFEQIVQASEEDLSLCPGFGPQKAKRLHCVFHEPFLKARRKDKSQNDRDLNPSPTKKTREK